MIKTLTFSRIFPNAVQPMLGVPVETRLRHLLADGRVETRVVAPVPWFPIASRWAGNYGDFARVPRHETRLGAQVLHPPYPVIPKVGMNLAPWLMYAWTRRAVAGVLESGYDFDLIDAHHFYPDGVAAALLGREFGKPVVITSRGTDINLIPRHRLARRMIQWAGRRADAMVAVCQALKDEMVEIGLEERRIHVLRNGVNLEIFRPSDRTSSRREMGLTGPVILSVGSLIARKGHDLIVRALPAIGDATLLIAGDGPEDGRLRALVENQGLTGRVRLLGAVAHDQLYRVYGAADVLVLASDREGWPNVLLESMACGTPVAATDIWGNPEVVTEPCAGRLIARRDPEAIAEAVRAILDAPPPREATRAYAEQFGWEDTTKGQVALFTQILSR